MKDKHRRVHVLATVTTADGETIVVDVWGREVGETVMQAGVRLTGAFADEVEDALRQQDLLVDDDPHPQMVIDDLRRRLEETRGALADAIATASSVTDLIEQSTRTLAGYGLAPLGEGGLTAALARMKAAEAEVDQVRTAGRFRGADAPPFTHVHNFVGGVCVDRWNGRLRREGCGLDDTRAHTHAFDETGHCLGDGCEVSTAEVRAATAGLTWPPVSSTSGTVVTTVEPTVEEIEADRAYVAAT